MVTICAVSTIISPFCEPQECSAPPQSPRFTGRQKPARGYYPRQAGGFPPVYGGKQPGRGYYPRKQGVPQAGVERADTLRLYQTIVLPFCSALPGTFACALSAIVDASVPG